MKVAELASILGRFDGDADIALERTRQTDIPGLLEVEMYDIGFKRHAFPGRETYLLYATTKVAPEDTQPASRGRTRPYARRSSLEDTAELVAITGDTK